MRNSYGNYGNYGKAYRSNRHRRNIGGTIALILAFILVLCAGVMVGTAYGNSLLPEKPDPDPAHTASEQQTSSAPEKFSLPSGVTVEKKAVEPIGSAFQSITLDEVTATDYIVIDRMTGAVLLEKNPDTRIYPASTTKIMTTALALEMSGLDEVKTANAFALGMLNYSSAKLGLTVGEEMTVRDLLYATMLPSACDAANVIADQSDLGFNNYVAEMIKRAADIGCTGTYFVNPSGIHSGAHFSTVSDLARMETYASLSPEYRKIVGTASYILPESNAHPAGWNVLTNSNPMLGKAAELFPGGEIVSIDGAKTGNTAEGGYSLVCNATTANGTQLVAVISGIPYSNGAGAYVCVPDMVAILKAAATCANSLDHKTYVEAGKALPATLDGGFSAKLPQKLTVVPQYGFTTTHSIEKLGNGTLSIFSGAESFRIETVYYDTAADAVNHFTDGSKTEIGYLRIVTASGEQPVDPIPLILQNK